MEHKKFKPFSLEKAKSGEPVTTMMGDDVRILCFDAKNSFPIVALVKRKHGPEMPMLYNENGKCSKANVQGIFDLYMKKKNKVAWANVYRNEEGETYTSKLYDTMEEAIADRQEGAFDTVKIEYEL